MTENINHTRRTLLKLSGLTAISSIVPLSLISQSCFAESVSSWQGYDKSIIIDGLSSIFDYDTSNFSSDTLKLFRQSGMTAINATVPYPGDDFAATNNKIARVIQLINQYSSHLKLVRTYTDVLDAKVQQQLGIIIGFQSTEMFGNDLTRISHFAQLGTRYMQLSYNGPSQFGSGGLVSDDQGITALGRDAITEMEANKVLVDLSHSGKQTVASAIKHSTRPLTLSHTGCNAVYQHPRNNDDAELKAIANKGGVVGLYLMPFLDGGSGEITAESLMNHIDYAINLCGEDHVSIGSDQGVLPVNDGPEYREIIRQDVERRKVAGISAPGESANRPPFIPQLNTIRRMELIGCYMKKRGHSDRIIEKVLGVNLAELYRRVW